MYVVSFDVMETTAAKSGVGLANVPVEELVVLFRCVKCLMAPLQTPVYTCRSGHPTCSNCFKSLYKSCSGCAKCKEVVFGRSYPLEQVLHKMSKATLMAITDCTKPLKTVSDKSIDVSSRNNLQPEKLENIHSNSEKGKEKENQTIKTNDKDEMKPEILDAGDCGTSCSRTASQQEAMSCRPVLCPYPCGRLVTLSGMFPHFEFHHPKVHVQTVLKDCIVQMDLRQRDVERAESRCLAVLIVLLDDMEDTLTNVRPTPAQLLKVTKSSQEMLRNGLFISTITVGRLVMPNPVTGVDSWWLTAWATSLYESYSLPYTMSVFSAASEHSVSFTGPLVSLHHSQKPREVYSSGKCLLIPPALINEMKCDPHIPLKLTVTYHSDLPQHYSSSSINLSQS